MDSRARRPKEETMVMVVFGHLGHSLYVDLWDIFREHGKFKMVSRLDCGQGIISADLSEKKTRRPRQLLVVKSPALQNDGCTTTIICHPGHEPLQRALQSFFKREDLTAKVVTKGR